MSFLDSFLSAVAAPDVLWNSRKQGENLEHFNARVQADINAETDPAKQLAMQRNLDAFNAEAGSVENSVTYGASATFAKEYREQAVSLSATAGKIVSNVIPWQVWAILGAAVALFVFLRFSPTK